MRERSSSEEREPASEEAPSEEAQSWESSTSSIRTLGGGGS